jgi:hypothetical protein
MRQQTQYGVECDQDWENLPIKDSGRHCDLCNKSVIDFISWDRKAILAYYEKHPKTCGRFKIEHIDPTIITTGSFFRKPKLLLLGILSALGIEAVYAQTTKEHVETVQTMDTDSVQVIINKNIADILPVKNEENIVTLTNDPAVIKTKKRIYLSKRFPFIHRRKQYPVLMGCPSF